MKITVLLVVVLALALVAAVLLLRKHRGKGGLADTWPFYAKKVLSEPEQVLYGRLVNALPECVILAQVQLSRVLAVKKGHNAREWNNRIDRMSLDYVVCLKDFSVVAAVELDDSSHETPSRMQADSKKEKALAVAGVALVRWHVKALPDEKAIRDAFVK